MAVARHCSKLRQLPQILSGGCKEELVSGALRSAQAQTAELEDALEMGKEHLDLLAPMPRTLIGRRVRQSPGDIARITSHNGVVKRVIPQQGFPFLGLRKNSLIPSGALARSFSLTAANDSISALREVPTHTWLEKRGAVSALYEQVFMQEDGWVMTLLLVDEDEEDEDADDHNWNRRNVRL